MRSKILDSIMAHGEAKCLELYDEYANGRITINECIACSNRVQEETQKKYQDEVNRLLTIEHYWKQ